MGIIIAGGRVGGEEGVGGSERQKGGGDPKDDARRFQP